MGTDPETLIAPGAAAERSSGVGKRAVRVLRLRDSPWVDGPGRTIIETAAGVDPSRVEYSIGLLVPAGATDHPMAAAARTRGLRHFVIKDGGGMDWEVVKQICELIRRHDIDILHTSDIRTNLMGALAVGFARRPILVATTHGWIANDRRRKLMRLFDKLVLRRFDSIVLVSRAMLDLLPRWWIPRSRLRVIHNALPTRTFSGDPRGAAHQRGRTGRLRVLNVGRLSPEKGQRLLLEAIARASATGPGFELAFAGIGPLEQELRSYAGQLGIAERVEFLGYVSDMPAEYARCDVVVQSSLTEGLPNVVLEAGFLGVPIIATRVGGTDEVIAHGESGYLINPGSVAEIETALQAFAQDPTRFEQMGAAARRRVIDEFSFETRTRRVTALYEELCGLR